MKRFTGAGRQAVEAKNWYAALSMALIIPDICGSLEDPGPSKSQKRYERWCRKWLEPEFTLPVGSTHTLHVFLSAEDVYQARNSIIHSGQAEIEEKRRDTIDRFEFFSDGSHLNYVGGGRVNGVPLPRFLQLRVDMFCETVFDAAERWDAEVANDEAIQTEKAKLLVVHERGTTVGGIRWG